MIFEFIGNFRILCMHEDFPDQNNGSLQISRCQHFKLFSPYISSQVHLLWPKWCNYFLWLTFHYSVKAQG